jgi:hypothetical protein
MVRAVSFSPYQGDTIKALQQRQQDLAKLQPIIPTRAIVNPIQGLASVADTLANEINIARAHRQEREATQGMAQLMSSFGDQGPSPDQIGAMAAYDPDLAVKLYEKRSDLLAEQARLKAQQEFQTSERVAGQEFQAGQTQAGYTHEGQVDTRELEQQRETERIAQANKLEEEKRAEAEKIAAEGRAAAAAQVKTVTGEEAKAAGLDPTRTWQIGTSGKATDITPEVPESYRAPTADEVKMYNLDPAKSWRVNAKTGKPEEVGGGGVTIQNVPAEMAAKIGLADEFLANYDSIRKSAAAGDMTGLFDYQKAVGLGRGTGGEAYRQLKSGSEALVRMLTGAGKSETEAQDEASQYLPTFTDDAATLVNKIDGLKSRLDRVRAGVTSNRNAPAAPDSGTATVLPQGVNEDDITATMQATGLTREQVLAKLKEKANAGS